MSDIQRRVVTLFEVHGANQIRAALGSMAGGFGSFRTGLDAGGRSANYLDMQMRALGTTLRYAFAGAGIYGTLTMVKNLGEFQAQLGEISSIATGPGGLPIVGQQIDQLGVDLLRVSNETTQPISDLQEGILSLYSTIGDVPPNEAVDMMSTISDVSITAQSNIQDTTQALLGMLNAFGAGTDELGRFGDEFFKVIQLSAGMPGSIYAQKLGVLAASASLGHFTPEQMGALAIGATRFGGAPATNMQYLAQMMLFLMHPRTGEAEKTLSSIGLGSRQRQQLGGWETLKRFLAEVNRRGGVGMSPALATASDEFLSQAESQGLTGAQIGLSGGGTDLIAKSFGRIQSQRMAAILSRLLTPEQVAGTENRTLDQYLVEVANSAGETDKAMARAMDYRRIKQAGNAMHNFGIEVGTAISPLLQLPARGITAGSQGFNAQTWRFQIPSTNQDVTAQQLELAGGALTVAGLLRVLRRGGRAFSPVRGLGAATAGMDVLSSDTSVRGDSPLKPLYVAVVYSLAGGGGGVIGPGPIGGGSGSKIPAPGEKVPSRMSTFRKVGLTGLGISGVLTAYSMAHELAAAQAMEEAVKNAPITSHSLLDFFTKTKQGGFHLGMVGPFSSGGFRIGGHHPETTDQESRIIERYKAGEISADAAERMLRRIATEDQLRSAGVQKIVGKADVTVTVDQPGDTPGTRKKTVQKIPVNLFPDFTVPQPQERAKPKTRRAR